MPRIVYSPKYNIGFYGLERLHPFDSRKYGRAWKVLRRHFGSKLKQFWIKTDRPANREELLLVHSEAYLLAMRKPRVVAAALEVPPAGYLPGSVGEGGGLSSFCPLSHSVQALRVWRMISESRLSFRTIFGPASVT